MRNSGTNRLWAEIAKPATHVHNASDHLWAILERTLKQTTLSEHEIEPNMVSLNTAYSKLGGNKLIKTHSQIDVLLKANTMVLRDVVQKKSTTSTSLKNELMGNSNL